MLLSVWKLTNWMNKSIPWWRSHKIRWQLEKILRHLGHARFVGKKIKSQISSRTSRQTTSLAMFPTPVTSVEKFPGQEMDWDFTKPNTIKSFHRTREDLKFHKMISHKSWFKALIQFSGQERAWGSTSSELTNHSFCSRTKQALRMHKSRSHTSDIICKWFISTFFKYTIQHTFSKLYCSISDINKFGKFPAVFHFWCCYANFGLLEAITGHLGLFGTLDALGQKNRKMKWQKDRKRNGGSDNKTEW